MNPLQSLIVLMGGMSPVAKMITAGLVWVAAFVIKYINARIGAKFGIMLPLPDAHFSDWLFGIVSMALVYKMPNTAAAPQQAQGPGTPLT